MIKAAKFWSAPKPVELRCFNFIFCNISAIKLWADLGTRIWEIGNKLPASLVILFRKSKLCSSVTFDGISVEHLLAAGVSKHVSSLPLPSMITIILRHVITKVNKFVILPHIIYKYFVVVCHLRYNLQNLLTCCKFIFVYWFVSRCLAWDTPEIILVWRNRLWYQTPSLSDQFRFVQGRQCVANSGF